MKAYDLKQVLWVEDDPKVTETYPLKAENFGLELVPYPCWDDAKSALENDYDRWSAIILDAKCKHHRDSKDSAVIFLREALKDLSVLSEKNGHIIPWYVLTGGDESEVSDSINDERMQWDRDWTESKNKKFYSKNVDDELLYKRIRYHACESSRIQIQKMYKQVFDAIEECGIDDNAYNALEDLLVPIHFPKEIDDKDFNDKFEKARTVLEYIFRSMSSHGILPEWGRQVNLRWSSCLLAGKPAKKDDVIIIDCTKQILPEPLMMTLKNMVDIIPAFCHSDSKDSDDVNKEEYLGMVNESTFLLKSFALQMCDFVLWYRNYLKEHGNAEENAANWKVLDYETAKVRPILSSK